MDMQTDVRRSAGFAAIVRALVAAVAEATAEEPYDRELYARRREAARGPPDPARGRGAGGDGRPALDGEDLELARLVLEGRPEAERQLELGRGWARRVLRDVVARTLG